MRKSGSVPAIVTRGICSAGLASLLLQAAAATWAQAPKAGKAPREDLTIDPATIMEPWKGDLDGMIERRQVRVLVVPSKTTYFWDRGKQRGPTYDAMQLVEEDLNEQLARDKRLKQKSLKVKFFFVAVRRDQLLQALVDGKGDIAAGNLTITPERMALVDFSAPIGTGVREVVLTGPASPAVSTLDDLAGKEVFVRKSSSYYESLVALNERFAAQGKAPVALKEAPEELEDEDLIEMLDAGLLSVLVVDEHKADFWKKVFRKVTVHDAIALRTGGEIAWAIRKDSPRLKAFLDGAVAAKGSLSKERERIVTRYLENLTYVRSAAAKAERKKFLALVKFFQKYGDRYDVDWILMAAQGYQESRLDQEARSPTGAIGIMQVMPETAKDLNVGDITLTEPNIHAGVKYMRFMIDQYFEHEPMTKLDKALFAFAAYNAGPGRVAQLRRESAKRGLDPNVWFHNVEYVAAEKIGPETVTYVSNIFKYYVAYRRIAEAYQARRQAIEGLKGASDQAVQPQ